MAERFLNNVRLNADIIKADTFKNIVSDNASSTHPENVNVANALSTMARWYDEITYMRYIMQGMMVARLVDYKNLNQSLLIGDFNRLNCFKNRRRCNVQADGTITAFYGDTGYTEDVDDIAALATPVDVMVYQPKFYYKVEPIELEPIAGSFGYHIRKAIYYISDAPLGGFKLHPAFINPSGNEVDYFLIGAYEGCLYDNSESAYDKTDAATAGFSVDTLASVANVKPASGIRSNLTSNGIEVLCNNKGTGWHCMGVKQESMNQLMMLIEYGPDSQTGIGRGVVDITDNTSYNCSSITGSTASLGNGSGNAASTVNEINGTRTTYTDNGKVSVSYRGMENPYGNMWEWVQGGSTYGTGASTRGGQPYIADDFNYVAAKYTDNYKPVGWTVPTFNSTAGNGYSGYITAFGYSGETYDWLFMGSEAGTIDTSMIKDHHYTVTSLSGAQVLVLGGCWLNASGAGAFYWSLGSGPSYRYRHIGGRLCWYSV